MKYLIIIGHDSEFGPSPELIRNILGWNQRMRDTGVLVDSNPLKPWDEAKTVRVRGGKTEVVSGSFSDSKEKVSAYAVITCATESEAVSIAASHPMATAAVVEVRPIWEDIAGT